MIYAAIQETTIGHVKNVVDDAQRGPLSLYRSCKSHAVIHSRLTHVDWPARVDRSCIQAKRKDQMFLGLAAVRRGHRVEKERA
jgi:hypothetical protein